MIVKFVLAPKQKSFFERHGYIEFEELVAPAALSALVEQLYRYLLTQAPTPLTSEALLTCGINLFRSCPLLQTTLANKELSSIAAQLLDVKQLRYGYDLLLPALRETKSFPLTKGLKEPCYPQFTKETHTLEEISSLTQVAGAFIFSIGRLDNTPYTPLPPPWPQKLGSALFIAPKLLIDLPALHKADASDHLLICFTSPSALYRPTPCDPNANHLKKLGYVIGDKLRSTTHPLFSF